MRNFRKVLAFSNNLLVKNSLEVKKEEDIIELLVEMNTNWAEGKWRDFGEPKIRYSEQVVSINCTNKEFSIGKKIFRCCTQRPA